MALRYFTINGRAYPSTDTIPMRVGETLKVRFIGSRPRGIRLIRSMWDAVSDMT